MASIWSKMDVAGADADAVSSLEAILKSANPELYASLASLGELDNYLELKAADLKASVDQFVLGGEDPETAVAMALEDLNFEDVDETVDEFDETVDEPDDFDGPQRMALQVGTVVNRNGTQYVLNENHRWTRKEAAAKAPPAAPQAQAKLSQPQMQKSMLNAPKQPAAPQPGGSKAKPAPESSDYETRVSAAEKEGMTRSDAQGYVEAQDLKKSRAASDPAAVPKSDVFGGKHNPGVDSDPNKDGITDTARVGVSAFDVPPPPKRIKRIPGLTGMAKKAEEHFATEFEKDPQGMIEKAIIMFTAGDNQTPVFETDACKKLNAYWQSQDLATDLTKRSQNRATLNTALHQTANAICKNAFVAHLDTLPEGSEILVTVGGCGAGKGFAMGKDKTTGLPFVPEANEMKNRAAVVWDSAGDQNATENPWILQEARKRGLKVNYVFVHADPKVSWADPGRGVVKRANNPDDGRMVDALVFADSYAVGAKNHAKFSADHANDPDCKFIFLKSGNPPVLSDKMPEEALTVDRHELAKFAVDSIKAMPDVPEHIRQGALAGTQIWGD